VEHAVGLAESRIEQAREFFVDYRQHLDALAGFDNFHERGAIFLERSIISVSDETVWNWWDDIPWITPTEMSTLNALLMILLEDTPGANIISIAYDEGTMTFAIFATPLHLARAGDVHRAWVSLRHGDPFVAWPYVQVVHSEALADGWYLTITSEEPKNESGMYMIMAIVATVFTIAAVGFLVWGIKTYRFLSDPGGVMLPILLLVAAAVLLLILTALFVFTQTGGGR